MTAAELHESLMVPSAVQCVQIAEAYIEEQGDLPEVVWYQLGLVQPDAAHAELVWNELEQLRKSFWQEAWGEDPAPYGTLQLE